MHTEMLFKKKNKFDKASLFLQYDCLNKKKPLLNILIFNISLQIDWSRSLQLENSVLTLEKFIFEMVLKQNFIRL